MSRRTTELPCPQCGRFPIETVAALVERPGDALVRGCAPEGVVKVFRSEDTADRWDQRYAHPYRFTILCGRFKVGDDVWPDTPERRLEWRRT